MPDYCVSLDLNQLMITSQALISYVSTLSKLIEILEDSELVAKYKTEIYEAQIIREVLINSIGRRYKDA